MVPKNGYIIPYLRGVVHYATIYIRPLQKNQDLEAESASTVSVFICYGTVQELCLYTKINIHC